MSERGERIERHDIPSYTTRFMPSEELHALLRRGEGRFFVVRVEQMYPHVRHPVPPARSSAHTCLVITEGAARIDVGSERFVVEAGRVLFVPAGEVFGFGGGDTGRGFILGFVDDVAAGRDGPAALSRTFPFLQAWGTRVIEPDRDAAGSIEALLERMESLYHDGGLEEIALIGALLVGLLREAERACRADAGRGLSPRARLANRFVELVHAEFRQLRLVAAYADRLSVSPNHLTKTVTAVTGRSPSRWIDELTVMEAKVLLRRTTLSIGEIAAELGIDDQSYFTRLFRRHEAMTPTEYRAG